MPSPDATQERGCRLQAPLCSPVRRQRMPGRSVVAWVAVAACCALLAFSVLEALETLDELSAAVHLMAGAASGAPATCAAGSYMLSA